MSSWLPRAGITDVYNCIWLSYDIFVSMVSVVKFSLSFWLYLCVSSLSFFFLGKPTSMNFVYIHI